MMTHQLLVKIRAALGYNRISKLMAVDTNKH